MGEIADALRRARESRTRSGPSGAGAPDEAPPRGSALGEVLRRAREEAAPEAEIPAPEPSASRRPEPPTRVGLPESPLPPAARVVETLDPPSEAIVVDDGSAAVHQCRNLALRVRGALEQRRAVSVAVTSAVPQEGKTTVLCNLALALASLGGHGRVALLDLDLRKPSVARVLGVDAGVGMDQVLAGAVTLDDVRIRVERPPIDIYPAGEPHHGAHQLLGLPSLAQVIAELERRYALVLVDTPPTLLVPDTSLILQQVSTCIAIARAGFSRARPFKQLMTALPRRQMLGVLLNGNRPPRYTYYVYDQGADPEAPPTGVTEKAAKG